MTLLRAREGAAALLRGQYEKAVASYDEALTNPEIADFVKASENAALSSMLDAWLAQDLTPDRLSAKPFSPLPILGVPGWWAANADPLFYDDADVFRPVRQQRLPEKPSASRGIAQQA